MNWLLPINCIFIPTSEHPGGFGFRRKHDVHTGVDLYCEDGQPVYAVEDGEVVKIDYFTGAVVGMPWWETTSAVMIEGETGVVNYGEINPYEQLQIGQKISRGQRIGFVKRVLPNHKLRSDIPFHSTSMLHVELYKHGAREFANGALDETVLDPTPFLLKAKEDMDGRKTNG